MNAQSGTGHSPLMAAAEDDHKDVVALLLARGANPNLKDADGDTALSIAEEWDNRGVMRILLKAGATGED